MTHLETLNKETEQNINKEMSQTVQEVAHEIPKINQEVRSDRGGTRKQKYELPLNTLN